LSLLSARATVLGCAVALVACGGGHAVGASTRSVPAPTSATTKASTKATAATFPDGDWNQFNFNAQRTGVGPAATGITAQNFARLHARVIKLDGIVDSSVIQLHAIKVDGRSRDVLIMTTTYGRTIALDARSGKKLWEFVPSDIGSYEGSAQITTATPTADPDRQYVYATSPDGIVHKLSVTNGHQVWGRGITFDPTHEKLASPPTISGSEVIVVTDGYIGDAPPYQGHVVTISRATGRIIHVWNSLCSDQHTLIQPSTCPASDSAMFGRSGAVLEPGSGRILVATGNGPFNGHTNWGDSVLELAPDASHLLHNWTPTNEAELNANDIDLGSTFPALLPNRGGPPLAVQGGKDGILKLLNLDRLDGISGPAGPRLGGQLQELPDPGSTDMFTTTAVWVHRGRTYAFVATSSGTADYALHSGKHPRLSVKWSNGNGGTSPVLAGGLLYVFNTGGRLDVYVPGTGHLVGSLATGTGHWNSPIVVGGRIILPVGDANDPTHSPRELYIWHLPGR
jgi:outer membrane protein assembly factor BamB